MVAPDETHHVWNQPPPFIDLNLVATDRVLLDAVAANSSGQGTEDLFAFGERWGTSDMAELGRLANEYPPKLKTHDAYGRRADIVEFHPAYHALMNASMEAGLHASTWHETDSGKPTCRGHLGRAAKLFIAAQVETGHICPITMTHASVAALAASPHLLKDWLPRIRSRRYDPRFRPFWEKTGVTLGMGMTEKQGGTDVRANITGAELRNGDEYSLTGHKWFFSAPMCDAFLVLAQAPGGLTCFLVPRFRPDGTVNGLHLQRLKDKLGNRSNASSEVEFVDAFAWRIGDEGRGIRTIIEMVQLTRLDCAIASAGIVRRGLALALHHARHRTVFGRRLVDQPAMTSVISDLALEVEAMTALSFRLAASFDGAESAEEAAYARLLTPVAKFAICKSAPGLVYEAMECLGGNGYVEESPLPRLYREAPVNAIWEGSGNVMALDVLRAANRDPDAVRAVIEGLVRDAGDLPGVPTAATDITATLLSPTAEGSARYATERLAILAMTAALRRSAPAAVVEAYATTRLASPRRMIGANDIDRVANILLERALPLA